MLAKSCGKQKWVLGYFMKYSSAMLNEQCVMLCAPDIILMKLCMFVVVLRSSFKTNISHEFE